MSFFNYYTLGFDKQARHKPTVGFGGIYNKDLVHVYKYCLSTTKAGSPAFAYMSFYANYLPVDIRYSVFFIS